MRSKNIIRCLCAVAVASAAVLSLGGCRCAPPTEPMTVRLAVNDIYATETACSCVHDVAARTYDELQARLAALGIDLQLDYFPEPYHLMEAIRSGEYDGALCKPWLVYLQETGAGRQFERVADLMDPQTNGSLTAVVAVSADSPIRTLAELNGRSVVIGESDAYEKHYAAKRLFEKEGLRFDRIEQRASCIENLGMVLDGKVDAAVISDYALSADCAVDIAQPEDFRVLAATEPIPLTSVLMDCAKIDAPGRARLKDALLEVSREPPAGLLGTGFAEPAEWNPPERGK